MEQPLGHAIGVWLETREAIEMLQGKADDDFYQVTVILSAYMVWLGGKAESFEQARALVEKKLQSGEAYNIFSALVKAQGGETRYLEKPQEYPEAKFSEDIRAQRDGFVTLAHARTLGEISMLLGAGREKKEDEIDFAAGIILHKKVGDAVQKDERLATLYATKKPISSNLIERARSAFDIHSTAVAKLPSILGIIDENGKHAWNYSF